MNRNIAFAIALLILLAAGCNPVVVPRPALPDYKAGMACVGGYYRLVNAPAPATPPGESATADLPPNMVGDYEMPTDATGKVKWPGEAEPYSATAVQVTPQPTPKVAMPDGMVCDEQGCRPAHATPRYSRPRFFRGR